MNKNRRIKIAKIENKILQSAEELSIVYSLAKILSQCIDEGYNLSNGDTMNLSIALKNKLKNLQDKFNNLQVVLKI